MYEEICVYSMWHLRVSKYSEALLTILYFFSSMFIMIMEDITLYDCAFPHEILKGGQAKQISEMKLSVPYVCSQLLRIAQCRIATDLKQPPSRLLSCRMSSCSLV